MITVTGQAAIAEIQRKLRLIPAVVHDEADRDMADILTDLVAQAPDQTPWRKKPKGRERDPHMQDVYSSRIIVTAGTIGQLLNQRPYALWTARTGTSRSRPNARLKAWLEHKDDEISVIMEQAISRRVTALMR